jgi:acetyl esterase/lipase
MAVFEFLICWLVSALGVTWSRCIRGPLLPSWTWLYEVITRAQKRFHERVARRSPASERRAWSALRASGPALARVRLTRGSLGNVPVLRLVPGAIARPERWLVYVHGGGFMYGGERSHAELAAELALAAEAEVIFPIYRLAPEHSFPAALDDVLAVYTALLAEGAAATRVAVAGDSAGGNLALGLALRLRDSQRPLPAALVPISPWVDLAEVGGSMLLNERFDWASPWMFTRWRAAYVTETPIDDPLVSPLRAHLDGLPPMLLLGGSAEMLHDQIHAFVDKARLAGVEVAFIEAHERVHLWLTLTSLFPEFQAFIDEIGAFVRSKTGP